MKANQWWAGGAAIAVGVSVELLITLLYGEREAWDAPAYWTWGYPKVGFVAGLVGYAVPCNAWRWGMLPLPAQLGVMVIHGQVGLLLPVGVAFGAALSLPCIIASCIGSWLRRHPVLRQSG